MRRFNYTGRRRISTSDVLISTYQEDGQVYCDVAFDLDSVRYSQEVPASTAVILEAYTRTKVDRFPLGTLESPSAGRRLHLESFGPDENVLFRLKVVNVEDKAGRIIAMAKGIRPTEPKESHQQSLLAVSVEPLDDVVYKVDFPDGETPTLVLNEALDTVTEQGIKAMATDPLFVSLVYPEVVRQILTRILVIECDTDDEDDGETWETKWKGFARSLNPEPIPEPDNGSGSDLVLEWIEAAVSQISRNMNILDRFKQGVAEV